MPAGNLATSPSRRRGRRSPRKGPRLRVRAQGPGAPAGEHQLNGAANVVVVDRACWDSEGTSTLYDFDEKEIDLPINGKAARSGRRPRDHDPDRAGIDDVVKEPVRLVKIDVEGAELAALKGAERVLFTDPGRTASSSSTRRRAAPSGTTQWRSWTTSWRARRAPP